MTARGRIKGVEAFARETSKTSSVVTLAAQLARLDDLGSFFIRGQDLLTRLLKRGDAVSQTLFDVLALNGLKTRYENSVIQECLKPAMNFEELRKGLQDFHGS